MTNPNNLTNEQVKLVLGFIDRGMLIHGSNRLLPLSQRYATYIELVNDRIRDPLTSADVGIEDLRAARDYFTAKHGEMLERGR